MNTATAQPATPKQHFGFSFTGESLALRPEPGTSLAIFCGLFAQYFPTGWGANIVVNGSDILFTLDENLAEGGLYDYRVSGKLLAGKPGWEKIFQAVDAKNRGTLLECAEIPAEEGGGFKIDFVPQDQHPAGTANLKLAFGGS